jgi:DNA polymerase III alpha subunit (gram-positive type)
MRAELLRFKNKQKYLIFDTETEGLNLISSKPWQIAWIVAEGKNIISKNDRFIKWDNLKVSDGAAKITGFSYDQYERRAEDPMEVFNDFSKYLFDPEYIIIGQNLLGFDVYMINVWMKLMGLKSDYSYVNRIIDTKSLATAIFKNILIPSSDNGCSWQYKLLNHKERGLKTSQSFLLKHYNIPHEASRLHDALYDIEMNFQIFLKQIYDIEI